MFAIEDIIVYGSTGVCRITDITTPECMKKQEGRLYYVLEPCYSKCVIYAPVDTKVFMRPVISSDEARMIIDDIPAFPAEVFKSSRRQELEEHYDKALRSHSCRGLMELFLSLRKKKYLAECNKRRLGAVDERFLKQARELLMGELAAALRIEKAAAEKAVEERISTLC